MRYWTIIAMTVLTIASSVQAQVSKYTGQEGREIKSLSPDDIDELLRGGGWGLAKAAELNGVPGPAHLLELQDDVPLTADQIAEITDIYTTMQAKAIAKGEALIEAELVLETAFRDGSITAEILHDQVNLIADIRAELRIIHLSTHLRTPKILSPDQIAAYNTLRGYGNDPCAVVPEGHDAAQWRKHNGCS